jgi:hypothetical protein
MKINVLKNDLNFALKNLYTLKDLFENWLPLDDEKQFVHHLTIPIW